MKKTGWIILAVVALVVLWGFSSYNGLVSLDEGVKAQWAKVETVYQRRLDLIPNVISTVKGVTKQEQDIFIKLAEARANYLNAKTSGTIDDQNSNLQLLNQTLGQARIQLLALAENYPQLKSADAFRDLISELEGSENRIAVERSRYNDTVKDYNIRIRRIPTNIIAALTGFGPHKLFEADEGANKAPAVDFTK